MHCILLKLALIAALAALILTHHDPQRSTVIIRERAPVVRPIGPEFPPGPRPQDDF